MFDNNKKMFSSIEQLNQLDISQSSQLSYSQGLSKWSIQCSLRLRTWHHSSRWQPTAALSASVHSEQCPPHSAKHDQVMKIASVKSTSSFKLG